MASVTSYRDLVVWQRSMELAQSIYSLTGAFPKQEEYRLTSQMIRAAISIPANIAEGYMRSTRKDYGNFISTARGSAAELETFLILTGRMKFAPREAVAAALKQTEEISRMLNTLRRKLASPKT